MQISHLERADNVTEIQIFDNDFSYHSIWKKNVVNGFMDLSECSCLIKRSQQPIQISLQTNIAFLVAWMHSAFCAKSLIENACSYCERVVWSTTSESQQISSYFSLPFTLEALWKLWFSVTCWPCRHVLQNGETFIERYCPMRL